MKALAPCASFPPAKRIAPADNPASGDTRVSVGNLVLAFRLKRNPLGDFLSDDLRRKARLTIADKKTNHSDDTVDDFYSACVSSGTSPASSLNSLSNVAYYKGTPKTPEEGGRLVYARVPAYLHRYGDYPTHGPDGTPGCRDAGRIWPGVWEIENDKLLLIQRRMTHLRHPRLLHTQP